MIKLDWHRRKTFKLNEKFNQNLIKNERYQVKINSRTQVS